MAIGVSNRGGPGGPGGFGASPTGTAGGVLARFLPAAAAYVGASVLLGGGLAVANAAGLRFPYSLRWIHVHLALAIGLTHAIVGAIQYFAVPLLATSPPPPALLRLQLALLNAGAAGLVIGVAAGKTALVAAGGALVVAAVGALAWGLRLMARRSLARIGLGMRYYLTALAFGVAGMSLGVLMASGLSRGWVTPSGARLAHLHLNLLGWVGLTIVGTQFTLFPTVTGVAPWRERLAIPAFWLLSGGACGIAFGFLLGAAGLVVAGGAATLAGAVAFLAFMAGTRRRVRGPLPLSARHLYAAAWYLAATCAAGIVLSLPGDAPPSAWRTAYAHIGLVGFVLQTLIGAMVHLFPVLGAVYGGPGEGRRERLARWKGIMERHAGAQFWLLNAGVLGFALTRVLAGASQGAGELAPPALRLASGAFSLAMLAAIALLLWKVSRALTSARARES